jgi:hypothetical protein
MLCNYCHHALQLGEALGEIGMTDPEQDEDEDDEDEDDGMDAEAKSK